MIVELENQHGVKVHVDSATVQHIEPVDAEKTRLHLGLVEGGTYPAFGQRGHRSHRGNHREGQGKRRFPGVVNPEKSGRCGGKTPEKSGVFSWSNGEGVCEYYQG
jgi:hypothetical protein